MIKSFTFKPVREGKNTFLIGHVEVGDDERIEVRFHPLTRKFSAVRGDKTFESDSHEQIIAWLSADVFDILTESEVLVVAVEVSEGRSSMAVSRTKMGHDRQGNWFYEGECEGVKRWLRSPIVDGMSRKHPPCRVGVDAVEYYILPYSLDLELRLEQRLQAPKDAIGMLYQMICGEKGRRKFGLKI